MDLTADTILQLWTARKPSLRIAYKTAAAQSASLSGRSLEVLRNLRRHRWARVLARGPARVLLVNKKGVSVASATGMFGQMRMVGEQIIVSMRQNLIVVARP